MCWSRWLLRRALAPLENSLNSCLVKPMLPSLPSLLWQLTPCGAVLPMDHDPHCLRSPSLYHHWLFSSTHLPESPAGVDTFHSCRSRQLPSRVFPRWAHPHRSDRHDPPKGRKQLRATQGRAPQVLQALSHPAPHVPPESKVFLPEHFGPPSPPCSAASRIKWKCWFHWPKFWQQGVEQCCHPHPFAQGLWILQAAVLPELWSRSVPWQLQAKQHMLRWFVPVAGDPWMLQMHHPCSLELDELDPGSSRSSRSSPSSDPAETQFPALEAAESEVSGPLEGLPGWQTLRRDVENQILWYQEHLAVSQRLDHALLATSGSSPLWARTCNLAQLTLVVPGVQRLCSQLQHIQAALNSCHCGDAGIIRSQCTDD